MVDALREEDHTVNRVNYGVIFTYVGKIKPATTLLRHTFKIGMPMRKESNDAEFMKKLDVLNHNKNLCWQRKENGGVDISSYCKRFLKNLKFLRMLSMDGTVQINRLIKDVYDAVPMISTGKFKQNKRAILSFYRGCDA